MKPKIPISRVIAALEKRQDEARRHEQHEYLPGLRNALDIVRKLAVDAEEAARFPNAYQLDIMGEETPHDVVVERRRR